MTNPYGEQPTQQPYGQQPPMPGQPAQPFQNYGMAPMGQAAAAPRPEMGFAQAIKAFFQNYVYGKGRASKSEFMWPAIILWGLTFLSQIITWSQVVAAMQAIQDGATTAGGTNPLSWILSLAQLVFGIGFFALSARRLHDMNQSGWLALLNLIPLVRLGLSIWMFVGVSNPAGASYDDPTGKQPALGA